MASFFSLVLIGASALVQASPIQSRTPYVVKGSHRAPAKWAAVGDAPADHVLDLQIGLKQSRFDELERQLYEVSDPRHPRYGKHLTSDEVNKLVQPSEETSQLVHEWLGQNGINPEDCSYSSARDWIKVSLPVSAVERLLDTKYSIFKHKEEGSSIIRTEKWSLPQHLHDHIEAIQPTNSFMQMKPRISRHKIVPGGAEIVSKLEDQISTESASAAPAGCDVNGITPACLRNLYGTSDYVPKATDKNKMALTNYLGEVSNYSDTRLFLSKYRPDAVFPANQPPFTVYIINNGSNNQNLNTRGSGGLEGNLDSETLLGIGYPTPLITYNTGGSPPFKPDTATPTNTNEPYLEWVNYMLNLTDLPQTISTSYGDDEQTVPIEYAISVCKLFAQLGARGVTMFFSSGDSGVGPDNGCVSNDGKNTKMFMPAFPASCPYITAVGATKNFDPEVAAYDSRNGFTSGGGYSNYFATPDYQKDVVNNYTAGLGTQYKGLYNTSGRAYPDVSAQGQAYITIYRGNVELLDGTSASAPAIAAVFSLVNDALIAAGKPPMGFINPWLYQTGYTTFTDVTSGATLGCGSNGFSAKAGWDPVTGFGTPNFKKIRALVGA